MRTFRKVGEEHCKQPEGSGLYRFLGMRNDPLVGVHNHGVLPSWRGSIDWTPVLSKEAVINYIAKYASMAEKSSKSYTDLFREMIEPDAASCFYT